MPNKKYDILFVGAGLYSATFARLAVENGLKCKVIDKRDHIAGNIYDKKLEGINVHKYGAHIFHTSDDEVWEFVNRFATFNNYVNSPVANYKGELYNLPFNMNTFHQMWNDVITPRDAERKIDGQRMKLFPDNPKNLEEQALSLVGYDIYRKLVKGYTEKQWGKPCHELDPSIIRRLPVRYTYNNNYFNDKYQGIPVNGYTDMVKKMFDGCDTELGVDYFDNREKWNNIADTVVYTGPIDRFFDCRFGELEYRSLNFNTVRMNDCSNYQGNAVVNYTDGDTPYTRIIEHKHFDVWNKGVQELDHTLITYEYPLRYTEGCEPYYPVNNPENTEKLNKYQSLASGLDNVILGGRLGEFKYYDMDKTIRAAMDRFKAYYRDRQE